MHGAAGMCALFCCPGAGNTTGRPLRRTLQLHHPYPALAVQSNQSWCLHNIVHPW